MKRPLETLRSDDEMATRTKKVVLEGKTTTYICPILRFMKDVVTGDDEIFSLFLNLDRDARNSTPGG